jgi:hypothetical protein
MNFNKIYNYVLPMIQYLFSLSTLVFILNAFKIHPKVNVALYLLNILVLLGISVITYVDPFFIFNKLNYLPILENMDVNTFNICNFIFHIMPVYLFAHRNTIQEVFSLETIRNSIIILLIYFLFFYKNLENIYPLPIHQLILMSISIYILFIVFHYLFAHHLS